MALADVLRRLSPRSAAGDRPAEQAFQSGVAELHAGLSALTRDLTNLAEAANDPAAKDRAAFVNSSGFMLRLVVWEQVPGGGSPVLDTRAIHPSTTFEVNGFTAYPAASEHNREFQVGFIPDLDIRQISAAVDAATFANHRSSTKVRIGPNKGVSPDGDFVFDVGRVGILQGYAGLHPFPIDLFLQCLLHRGKLLSAIHAHDLPPIAHGECSNLDPVAQTNGHDVGQVVFTLLIMIAQFAQRRKEKFRRGNIDADVDFANLLLLGRRISLLDYGHESSAVVADDPAVARRLRHEGRKQRQLCPLRAVRIGHGRQRQLRN